MSSNRSVGRSNSKSGMHSLNVVTGVQYQLHSNHSVSPIGWSWPIPKPDCGKCICSAFDRLNCKVLHQCSYCETNLKTGGLLFFWRVYSSCPHVFSQRSFSLQQLQIWNIVCTFTCVEACCPCEAYTYIQSTSHLIQVTFCAQKSTRRLPFSTMFIPSLSPYTCMYTSTVSPDRILHITVHWHRPQIARQNHQASWPAGSGSTSTKTPALDGARGQQTPHPAHSHCKLYWTLLGAKGISTRSDRTLLVAPGLLLVTRSYS